MKCEKVAQELIEPNETTDIQAYDDSGVNSGKSPVQLLVTL